MWRLQRRFIKPDLGAEQALKEARHHLKRVKDRQPEVTREAEAAKDLRERNHFADQVYDLFSGREVSTE